MPFRPRTVTFSGPLAFLLLFSLSFVFSLYSINYFFSLSFPMARPVSRSQSTGSLSSSSSDSMPPLVSDSDYPRDRPPPPRRNIDQFFIYADDAIPTYQYSTAHTVLAGYRAATHARRTTNRPGTYAPPPRDAEEVNRQKHCAVLLQLHRDTSVMIAKVTSFERALGADYTDALTHSLLLAHLCSSKLIANYLPFPRTA